MSAKVLLLSILCSQRFNVVIGTNITAQNQKLAEKICDKYSNCPVLRGTFQWYSLPSCYCDNECEIFKDCCKQNVRETRNISNMVIANYDIPRTSICLRKEDDYVGFHVVNQCGENGPVCVENMTWSTILSHLPVTDKHNESYFGAQCAQCNNVTDYKNWRIFVQDLTTSSRFQFLDDFEEAGSQNITSVLHNLPGVFLVPPPDVSLRICYNFQEGNDSSNEQCPAYQNPVTHIFQDEKRALFRNLECCRNEGNCSPLTREGCTDHKFSYLRTFQIRESDIKGQSVGSRLFGVLLQFKEIGKKCQQIPCNDECHNSKKQCQSEDVSVFNYPLLKGRYLRLSTSEPYSAIGRFTDVIMAALANFLLESKWRIRLDWLYRLNITQGSECDPAQICTVMESYFSFAQSNKDLSYSEIRKLKAWTERINFRIHLNTSGSRSNEVVGSFSESPDKGFRCTCGKFEHITIKEYYDFSISIPIIKKIEFHRCNDFNFVLMKKNDVMNLNVSCNNKHDGENSCNILGNSCGLLAFLMIANMYLAKY